MVELSSRARNEYQLHRVLAGIVTPAESQKRNSSTAGGGEKETNMKDFSYGPYAYNERVRKAVNALREYNDTDLATALCHEEIKENQSKLPWLLLCLISLSEDKYIYAGSCLKASIGENIKVVLLKMLVLAEKLENSAFDCDLIKIQDFIHGFFQDDEADKFTL